MASKKDKFNKPMAQQDMVPAEQLEGQPASFDETFDALTAVDDEVLAMDMSGEDVASFNLGGHLFGLFGQAEKDKVDVEGRFMEDLRQYKGIYSSEIKSKMKNGRSKAFIALTRTKVNAVDARIMDLEFPSNGEMNWSVAPTPDPKLPIEVVHQAVQEWTIKTQRQPTPDDIQLIVNEEAKKRAERMARRIMDQLKESKYRDVMRQVVHSGNLYGTGILKGPLVDYRDKTVWSLGPDGRWIPQTAQEMLPYVESVSVWDIYPDMAATDPEDLRYVFQRHVMSRTELARLADREDFNGQEIMDYIRSNKDGDATYKNHEQELRGLDSERSNTGERLGLTFSRDKRYEVIEYWGYLDAEDIKSSGQDLPEQLDGLELCANVWLLRDKVIKFEVAPVQAIGIPYYWYYFVKDETSIFGEGIPIIMRDPQRLFNACVRALLDNTAASAGPIYEINEDLLMPGQNPDQLLPFTNVYRGGRGIEAQHPAIRVHAIQSHAQLYVQLINLFSSLADEATSIPKYLHGSNQGVGGAGRTMGGLSMLMGNSITVVKDQVKCLDDQVIKPFIRAMYHWNMELSDDVEIKGDFEVDAQGSASLIAKEVRAEKLVTYLQQTANPLDAPLTNRAYLHREIARCLDLGEQAVKTDAVIAQEQAQNAQVQQQMAVMQQAIKELQSYIAQLEQAVKGQHISSLTGDPMGDAQREVLVDAATQ